MRTLLQGCRALAINVLDGYRLTPQERTQEVDRLAQSVQQTIEAELENLEHRRVS